jgi:hypothetical protein
MQDFHSGAGSVYENETVTHTNIVSHLVLYNSAQRVHPFAHVGFPRTEKIAHGII